MNAKTVLKYASEQGAKFVSVRFTDLPGSWQHLTFPIAELGEDQFEDGFGFDASSIRGWAAIHESDMLLVPDAGRFWMDPFAEQPTLCIIGNAVDPITKEGYAFDPRSVAVRAENYLKFTGLGDTAYFGPEAEFFVFDSAKFHNEQNSAGYSIDSDEGHWNSGRDANEFQGSNLGYRIRAKEGYVPVPPTDTLSDLRSEKISKGAECRCGRGLGYRDPQAGQSAWRTHASAKVCSPFVLRTSHKVSSGTTVKGWETKLASRVEPLYMRVLGPTPLKADIWM